MFCIIWKQIFLIILNDSNFKFQLVQERTMVSNVMMENAFSTNLNAMRKMIVMTEVMKRIVHQENRKESRIETNIDDILSEKKRINSYSISKLH